MYLRGFHAQILPGCIAFLEQAKAQRAGGAMAAAAARRGPTSGRQRRVAPSAQRKSPGGA